MILKDYALIDLHRRIINFISSNYPNAIIIDNDNNTAIAYPNEYAKIIIFENQYHNALVVRLSLEAGAQMSKANSKDYQISTLDELNSIKPGIEVTLEQISHKKEQVPKAVKKAYSGQGYLLDEKKELLGVVDVSLIPTNAFVVESDIRNNQTVTEKEDEKKEKTINKFFKK